MPTLTPEEIKQRAGFAIACADGKPVIGYWRGESHKYGVSREGHSPDIWFNPDWRFEIPEPAAERLAKNQTVKERVEGMKREQDWFIDEDGKAWRLFASGEQVSYPTWVDAYDWSLREVPIPEQNAATRKEWESYQPTDDPAFRVDKQGRKCRVEWLDKDDKWRPNDEPLREKQGWTCLDTVLHRIVPLPAPTIEPWTFDDCPVGIAVRVKANKCRFLITGVLPSGVIMGAGTIEEDEGGVHSFQDLLNNFETLDNPPQPCGRLIGGAE